jgi:hypothetical protein
MKQNRIFVSAVLGLLLVSPGLAQSPSGSSSGAKQQRVQPRPDDVANSPGGPKQRQPRPSTVGDPPSPDPADAPSAEDERMNRILNGICRGC